MTALKRILCLASWYPNENDPQEGIFIKHQLQEISKLYEVILVSLRPGDNFDQKITVDSGIKHYRYSYPPKQYLSKHLSWVVFWNKIIRDFPEKNIDLIHLHVIFPLGIIAVKFQKKFKAPLVISEHWTGYVDPKNPIGKIRRQFVRHVLKKADLILTVSNYLKQNLLQLSPESSIEVIPNIVEFSENQNSKPRLPNSVTLLNVSDHVDAHKNISGLLEAVKPILEEYPNLKLVLVGSGEDTPLLKTMCQKMGITDQVIFRGRLAHENVLLEIQQADIGIVNSNFETFSIVSFEFLAAQKPIIITDCGGPIEYLPQEFGIKIPVNQSKQLTQAIRKMINIYGEYNLEDSALQIRNQFSRETFRKRIKNVYQKVWNAQ